VSGAGGPTTSAGPPGAAARVDTGGSWGGRDASAGSIPPVRPAPESITMSPAKLRSMVELTDAVVDEARIVMKPTRPTPIMSADALAAVRLGFRMAFALASLPGTAGRRGSGAPIAGLNGSETVRPSTDTAKNTSSAPAPTTSTRLPT